MRLFTVVTVLALTIPPAHAQQYGWVQVAQLGNQFTTLQAVEFVDSMHGWTAEGGTDIYRTADGGSTWISYPGSPMGVRSISMIDTLNGWSVGAQASTGKVIRTSNGGINWVDQWILNDRAYNGTAAQTKSRNTTAGSTQNFSPDTGKVVQTSNGGTTWTERTIADTIGALYQVQFIDSLHGWMLAGVSGWPQSGILRTSDGGTTWNLFRAPRGFQSVSFIDTLRGWAVNLNTPTYSYATTDGGVTWALQGRIYDPMWDDLHPSAISFVDSLHGWAYGNMFYQGDLAAAIFRTTDGGLSWSPELQGGGARGVVGMMVDRYHGWAVGTAGNVFAYRLITGVPERLERIPLSFALRQNYPNPFNPTTSIEFDLAQRSYVMITVHDINGREVQQLVNSELQTGAYRVSFDAHSLASGLYYYTLKTDSFSQTRSMLLIK